MHARLLGELEKQVMDIVWECNNCTVASITKRLQKRRVIAYTTVATVLQRLYEKKLLKRIKQHNCYTYVVRVQKKSYLKKISNSFLKKLIRSFGDVAIVSFAESIEDLPKAKKKRLLELLDEYEKRV
ncbi:MAG: BlaI/MecI/CopY family transcriptional regulator [Candidatus Paceibacterota bacterium]